MENNYAMYCALSNGLAETIDIAANSFCEAYNIARSVAETDFIEGELYDWRVEEVNQLTNFQAFVIVHTSSTTKEKIMDQITVSRTCPFCKSVHTMTFDFNVFTTGMRKYEAGARIQDAFPTFTPDEREFLKTGICDDCWNSM